MSQKSIPSRFDDFHLDTVQALEDGWAILRDEDHGEVHVAPDQRAALAAWLLESIPNADRPAAKPAAGSFFVPGMPAPQGSKRHVGKGRMVEDSKRVPAWRKQVSRVARVFGPRLGTAPVAVTLEFVMPRPKAWGKMRADPMVQRPDVDKLARAVLDGLTGFCFDDDSQVISLVATKRRAAFAEMPGVRITVIGL